MSSALPTGDDIAGMLEDLLGKKVPGKKPAAPLPIPGGCALLATYVDAQGNCTRAMVTDIQFAAYMGAALTGIPVGVAKDAVKARTVEEGLLDNIKEVCNIIASLLNLPGVPHVKLADVFVPVSAWPADMADKLAAMQRVDLEVSIPGYADGKLAVLG